MRYVKPALNRNALKHCDREKTHLLSFEDISKRKNGGQSESFEITIVLLSTDFHLGKYIHIHRLHEKFVLDSRV